MPSVPSVFPLWHIALTGAITFGVSLIALLMTRRWVSSLSIAECIRVAVLAGASVIAWRAIGNVPLLNDDPVPPFSPNDVLCPVITFVCLCVYDGLRRNQDRPTWQRMCSVLVIVSFVVNVIAI